MTSASTKVRLLAERPWRPREGGAPQLARGSSVPGGGRAGVQPGVGLGLRAGRRGLCAGPRNAAPPPGRRDLLRGGRRLHEARRADDAAASRGRFFPRGVREPGLGTWDAEIRRWDSITDTDTL